VSESADKSEVNFADNGMKEPLEKEIGNWFRITAKTVQSADFSKCYPSDQIDAEGVVLIDQLDGEIDGIPSKRYVTRKSGELVKVGEQKSRANFTEFRYIQVIPYKDYCYTLTTINANPLGIAGPVSYLSYFKVTN
jgi:hypothetical protein